MSGPVKIILRVKELKEKEAFRVLVRRRGEADKAREAADAARRLVEESAATLPAREDAIYREVIGKVINLGDLDETRGKVVVLEREHRRLADAMDRAVHLRASAEKQLAQAADHHKTALRTVDKYGILTEEIDRELQAAAVAKEEAEVEDLFVTRRRRPQ